MLCAMGVYMLNVVVLCVRCAWMHVLYMRSLVYARSLDVFAVAWYDRKLGAAPFSFFFRYVLHEKSA